MSADWIRNPENEEEKYRMEAQEAAMTATHAALERAAPVVATGTIAFELTRLERWFARQGKVQASAVLAGLRDDLLEELEAMSPDAQTIRERQAMRTYGPQAVDLLSDLGWHGNWHETDRGRLIWTGHAARKAGSPIEDPRETCTRMAALARGDAHDNV